ncbi:hypothetical protein NPIL_329171 [Nephila pilipes]|uniref:Uncharacterized protein n=1 Tax=Nephila pilipes TaxID=299642 RepID=A0A8X6Q7W3_NEPPI|nr:hypothetical protein NPIL_329171 [Nephila pilipes]
MPSIAFARGSVAVQKGIIMAEEQEARHQPARSDGPSKQQRVTSVAHGAGRAAGSPPAHPVATHRLTKQHEDSVSEATRSQTAVRRRLERK